MLPVKRPRSDQLQAMGLAFSVPPGVPVPSSLKNMYRELKQDCGCSVPNHGSLAKVSLNSSHVSLLGVSGMRGSAMCPFPVWLPNEVWLLIVLNLGKVCPALRSLCVLLVCFFALASLRLSREQIVGCCSAAGHMPNSQGSVRWCPPA